MYYQLMPGISVFVPHPDQITDFKYYNGAINIKYYTI